MKRFLSDRDIPDPKELWKTFEELKRGGNFNGGGITAEQISALDGLFKIVAYKEDASSAYEAFKDAFGIGESGGNDSGDDNTSGGESGGDDNTEHTHSYTSSVTTEATCSTDGVRTYTCSCGHSYTEAISATGHNYVDGVCAVCGAVEPQAEKFYFELKQGVIRGWTPPSYMEGSSTRVSYVGFKCVLIPNNTYRLVGVDGVRYGIHQLTESGYAKTQSAESLAEGTDKIDSGWQTSGYTFTANSQAVCAWITASFENGDITPEQAMPVYLEGEFGEPIVPDDEKLEDGTMIYNWDLTDSLTDKVNGVIATLSGIGDAPTQDTEGLHFTAQGQCCDFGAIYKRERTYELDILSHNAQATNVYGRLWMVDTDANTATGGSGFIYTGSKRSTGWEFYSANTGGWNGSIGLNGSADDRYSDAFFDGKTIKFYVDANGHVTASYKEKGADDSAYIELAKTTYAFQEYNIGRIYCGSKTDGNSECLCNTTIEAMRVYKGVK